MPRTLLIRDKNGRLHPLEAAATVDEINAAPPAPQTGTTGAVPGPREPLGDVKQP
jgi:hypothetical protein